MIAFSCKDHGADAGEVSPTLRSMGHDGSHANAGGQVAVAFNWQGGGTQTNLGFDPRSGITGSLHVGQTPAVAFDARNDDASTYEADASSALRTLRIKVGAVAVAEWGSRILDSLQSQEVLQSWLHGESLRRSSGHFRTFVDDCALPREKGSAARTLQLLWQNGPDGRTSQGRGLAKQLAQQLGKTLPELPSARASEQPSVAVRRLTPKECERLMGFPDDFTLIPYRGKPAADGPRYKALGNSMAVPCMRWIGQKIMEAAQ
jgi:DNA (cytosine-5)-methyltransferase 1